MIRVGTDDRERLPPFEITRTHRLSRGGASAEVWVIESKRPLAHPPEPGYPCFVSDLGELAWVAPREGLAPFYASQQRDFQGS